jgi:hypothetical protein
MKNSNLTDGVPKEILDTHTVFLRIHKVDLDLEEQDEKEKIKPTAFDKKGDDGLSVDWSEYSTPKDTRLRAKKPEDNGVLSFSVKSLREIPLAVIHKPTTNYAHSIIVGIPPRKPSDLGIRVRLRRICKWEIHYKSDE